MISHKLNFNGETECRDKIYQTRGDVANNIYIEQRPKYLGFISKKSATYPGLIRFAVLILCTGVVCCLPLKEHNQPVPIHERQNQQTNLSKTIVGAQLSANQTALNSIQPRLLWSHTGSDNYLNGIDHVTHHHGVFSFDCLEIIREGIYLTTVQLTYKYSTTTPSTAVPSYFTLTRFRGVIPFVISKSAFMVPSPENRSSEILKKPVTMVRTDPFQKKDRVCVIVSHPGLIYASEIDNFFGIVSL